MLSQTAFWDQLHVDKCHQGRERGREFSLFLPFAPSVLRGLYHVDFLDPWSRKYEPSRPKIGDYWLRLLCYWWLPVVIRLVLARLLGEWKFHSNLYFFRLFNSSLVSYLFCIVKCHVLVSSAIFMSCIQRDHY